MEKRKVLLVDDEPEVLQSFKRRFHTKFDMELALSGEEGLSKINAGGAFAVILSDYRMPGMDGIEFLSKAKELTPDTVRIMLTGQPELSLAVQAVNEGQIFRFLTKPCPPDILARAIGDGIKYYELVLAERELYSVKRWRKSIEDIIVALVTLAEARDPYTAGHELRVARLAQSIAVEIGLKEDQVEAIRMAATIHDIGKLYVPAEFLNKPGPLSEVEFNVIKEHPQIGYDVLKKIDFEYPIGRIVLQHHERIDGSGYPLGLSGDDILLESRILTVADVVEAMNSHRPYRPSLGIDAALKEIMDNKGRYYDPIIADTCYRLVTRKSFSF